MRCDPDAQPCAAATIRFNFHLCDHSIQTLSSNSVGVTPSAVRLYQNSGISPTFVSHIMHLWRIKFWNMWIYLAYCRCMAHQSISIKIFMPREGVSRSNFFSRHLAKFLYCRPIELFVRHLSEIVWCRIYCLKDVVCLKFAEPSRLAQDSSRYSLLANARCDV